LIGIRFPIVIIQSKYECNDFIRRVMKRLKLLNKLIELTVKIRRY
jgi:hypothetical protein